jgi:hypothetical protein
MKIFELDKKYSIVCNWQSTRNGFKHTASLFKNGLSIYDTKICYLNRTWEYYEYESVCKQVIDKYFNALEAKKYKTILNNKGGL